jgi:hypothetical protein
MEAEEITLVIRAGARPIWVFVRAELVVSRGPVLAGAERARVSAGTEGAGAARLVLGRSAWERTTAGVTGTR